MWNGLCKSYERRQFATAMRQVASLADFCQVIEVMREICTEVVKATTKLTNACKQIVIEKNLPKPASKGSRSTVPLSATSMHPLCEKSRLVLKMLHYLRLMIEKGLVGLLGEFEKEFDMNQPWKTFQVRGGSLQAAGLNEEADIFLSYSHAKITRWVMKA